jgi:hypothetical protein
MMLGKRKPRAVSSFLKKTYALLQVQPQAIQEDQNNQIVRWASSGIGFIVVHEEAFAQLVLPKYFKHSNYSSFVRQVLPPSLSLTCIISTRYAKATHRATSTIPVLTALNPTNLLKYAGNLKRRNADWKRTRRKIA